VPPEFVGGIAVAAAQSGCCSGEIPEADKVDVGAPTRTVNAPVTGAVPLTAMVSGFGLQLTPGGSPVPAQESCTLPVKPPVGVTVMVDTPLLPAVTVTGDAVTLNEPEEVTLTEIAADGPEGE
jgi:hypothetical protein